MTLSAPSHLIDDALWSRSLTKDMASQLVGQTLEFFYGDQHGQTHIAQLRVTSFHDTTKSGNRFAQFNLEFIGPREPQLPQQTYRMRHIEWGDFAIGITAIGANQAGNEYQACFSHEV
jgi:hypothetical protein